MTVQPHVHPGELIRVEVINDLLDRVTALEAAQLSTPPPSGDVVISSVPATVRVGDPMTISGANFGHSTGATVVTLDGRSITAFASASDTQLVFIVPDISTSGSPLPASGRTVVVNVSNATSTRSATTVVLPRVVVLEGDIELTFLGTTPATPVAGSFFVEYRLTSRATLDVDVTLTPQLDTGWAPLNVRLTQTAAPLSPATITLSPGDTPTFFVEVTVPGTAATGTPFSLDVAGTGGGLLTNAPQQVFNVGSAAPQEASYIDLSVPTGASVSVAANDSTTVNIDCEFTQTGDFDLTATFPDGPSGWALDLSDVPTPIHVTTIPASGKAAVPIDIGITAPGSASGPVQLVIYVQEQGQTIGRHLPLTLSLS
jgi:hypothetical protein